MAADSSQTQMRETLWAKSKRWLFTVHRWLGITTCLLSVMWLLSGLVMLYVAFPSWTDDERIAKLSPVAADQVRITPADALRRAGIGSMPTTFRLEMLGFAPVYRIIDENKPISLSAVTGELIDRVSVSAARQQVELAFPADKPKFSGEVDYDQWTVTRRYDPHRPLLKFGLANASHTIVYVSSTSGELVQDTTRTERFWNWFGAIPHWVYFAPLRREQELWRQIIMWLSGLLVIGALTGLWLGVMQMRWKRDSRQSLTPYRGWFKWHHLGGLAGGLFLTAWIASGWLSVNPFHLFASASITQSQRERFSGWKADMFEGIGMAAIAKAAGSGAKEISFLSVAGLPLIRSHGEHGTTLLDARTLATAKLDEATLVGAAKRAVPGAGVTNVEWVTAETRYWYSHQTKKPLPVLQISFDDFSATWLFIDPARGEITGSIDRPSRSFRWLFNFFHRYDLPILLRNQPVREFLIWLLSMAALVVAVSGVTLASRKLRKLFERSA